MLTFGSGLMGKMMHHLFAFFGNKALTACRAKTTACKSAFNIVNMDGLPIPYGIDHSFVG